MNDHRMKHVSIFAAAVCCLVVGACLAPTAQATLIVDDSFADGDLAKTGALDSNWWTSSSSSGIEISPGSLGMVTGTSGRGIHTVFPTQTLANVGDKLVTTYTFTTPATTPRSPSSAAFKVGLFDTLGRAGLDANVPASSGSPNDIYGWSAATPPTAGLPGYMMDMDVTTTGLDDLNFREHDATTATPSGRLLQTNSGFTSIGSSGPDGAYQFAPNTTYTGSLTLTRISATEMEILGTLSPGTSGIATHSVTDVFDSDQVGMLAFHANSNIFGSTSTQNVPDNGIDFSNIKVEFFAIPEPASLILLGLSGAMTLASRRRRGV